VCGFERVHVPMPFARVCSVCARAFVEPFVVRSYVRSIVRLFSVGFVCSCVCLLSGVVTVVRDGTRSAPSLCSFARLFVCLFVCSTSSAASARNLRNLRAGIRRRLPVSPMALPGTREYWPRVCRARPIPRTTFKLQPRGRLPLRRIPTYARSHLGVFPLRRIPT
jgi:hypothetical protein